MEIIADNVLRLVSWCYSCFEHEAIVRMKNSDSVRERERDSKFVEIILWEMQFYTNTTNKLYNSSSSRTSPGFLFMKILDHWHEEEVEQGRNWDN